MENWTPECDRLLEAARAALAAEPQATAVIAAIDANGTSHRMAFHGELTDPSFAHPFLETLKDGTALRYMVISTPRAAGIVPSFDFSTRLQALHPENRDCQLILESVTRDTPAGQTVYRTIPLHTCTDVT